MSDDPNFDPRDEIEARPQVTFKVAAGSESLTARFAEIAKQFFALKLPYHDMMAFDPDRCVVRFVWEAPRSTVDQAATWLESVSGVIDIRRYYGSQASSD
jgi:hypothetical protein